ncbi:MAG: SDR family NAD(P)-dependent oxidoreductase [Pirellulales bacterium]
MRLAGKIAIVVGAGQTPGDTIGNGRATALVFAREGAAVLLVDRDAASAQETQALIERAGGTARIFAADAAHEDDCRAMVETCLTQFGRVDILHNNVGIGAGDSDLAHLDEAAWDRILSVNLKCALFACKHVVPVMRRQQAGSIINISSLAATAAATELTAYKVSKAGLNALTQSLAIANAPFNVRVNAIAPGLIETPMAIESIARNRGVAKEDLIRERNARVPLGNQMGTAWDVAHAALFLASDEAKFITGVVLPVDGGQGARIG